MTAMMKPLTAAIPADRPAAPTTRRVFVRDFVLPCRIGVHAHEQQGVQRVRINLDLCVEDDGTPLQDDLRNVVCYDAIITKLRQMITESDHLYLIETLAEQIAQLCLADKRLQKVAVQVEKLDVYQDVASVGVAIERFAS